MEQVLSIVVRNQPGVLMRVAGMFSRRGYNIDSLAVGITQNPEFSRMTVTMQANATTVDQVCKQLEKLVEVEAVKILPPHNTSQRSMALVKVKTADKRLEILRVADVFRAHAIDISGESLTFLITGDIAKLHAFVEVMKPYGIMEMVQTGAVALERGEEALTVTKSRYNWPQTAISKNTSEHCKLI
ncbi:MAG: acetolactate synthase small subunit [Acidaminococcaceae bacterium]|nr:acetolactate synthase small subunit [Acidaminococcaceae bacterium]